MNAPFFDGNSLKITIDLHCLIPTQYGSHLILASNPNHPSIPGGIQPTTPPALPTAPHRRLGTCRLVASQK